MSRAGSGSVVRFCAISRSGPFPSSPISSQPSKSGKILGRLSQPRFNGPHCCRRPRWLEDLEDREHSEGTALRSWSVAGAGQWRAKRTRRSPPKYATSRGARRSKPRPRLSEACGRTPSACGRDVPARLSPGRRSLPSAMHRTLSDLALAELEDDLPAEVAARPDEFGMLSRSFDCVRLA